jgi:signal recognition particle subunit SRP54
VQTSSDSRLLDRADQLCLRIFRKSCNAPSNPFAARPGSAKRILPKPCAKFAWPCSKPTSTSRWSKELIDHIQAKAVGQEVLTALSPGEQVIKIVRDELVETLGKDTARMKFASQPPTVVLMAGLQGSGKTTTSGKLAQLVQEWRPSSAAGFGGRVPSRGARAVEGCGAGGQSAIYEGEVGEANNTRTVERAAKEARREAIVSGCDVLIVDTAGRLHIDDDLMDEMQSLKKLLNPSEILFVADAMTGQDAVRSADEFHKKLSLTGVILTKMDGDARGGAALSIRQVTGQPIKFIGVGEKYDALEPFHPDRIVSRILGMGDILSLIERAERRSTRKKRRRWPPRPSPATASRWKIFATSCGK